MEQNLYSMSTSELGNYAKVFLKDKLKALGIDAIDYELKGTDLCVILKDKYLKFKVKSVRKPNTGYIKIKKKSVDINDDSLFIATILFYKDDINKIFLITVADLTNENNLFRNRDYIGMKSTPEWGLNITDKNMDILNQYELSKMLNPPSTF